MAKQAVNSSLFKSWFPKVGLHQDGDGGGRGGRSFSNVKFEWSLGAKVGP